MLRYTDPGLMRGSNFFQAAVIPSPLQPVWIGVSPTESLLHHTTTHFCSDLLSSTYFVSISILYLYEYRHFIVTTMIFFCLPNSRTPRSQQSRFANRQFVTNAVDSKCYRCGEFNA